MSITPGQYEKIQWYDHVVDQNGNVIQQGTPLSATNLNRMEEGIDIGDNVVGLLVVEVLTKLNAVNKELEKWRKQRLQQGTVTIYNKFVINGCVISKMPNSRYIQITKTGTYTQGEVSLIFAGKVHMIPDEQQVALIPTNPTGSSITYYAYLQYDSSAGRYKVYVGQTVPADALKLYRIVVPANDQGSDLTFVTLYDERRIETGYPFYFSSDPYSVVTLTGFPMLDSPDYDVHLTVESASDLDRVGRVEVYDKTANSFKIKYSGLADNVTIRWTIINPDIA
ncbi:MULTISPECIES: hypothetical protein [Caloramator]|uniref:Uncharacterized protein n=1 Tax=Caloramator australicus RC3 TaxID=857293 RepID=I7LIF4_9CLOT|nr:MULTISPECIES: hypothetical protein [Caloramator]MDO6355268.1 hypothetical protein [Caloramator sp. CAR-1]CCJ32902.1 hypothetical protein CAAU_0818 [Caloramator australicus RC3]